MGMQQRGGGWRRGLVAAGTLAACAGSNGGNAPTVSISPTGQGTYRVVIEAEASGPMRINLRVEPPGGPGGDATGAGAGGTAGAVPPTGPIAPPSTPVSYTLVPSPPGVSFIDVCATPGSRRVLTGVDDATWDIPEASAPAIPFPVRLYDAVVRPPFTVASNGWLAFSAGAPMGSLSGSVPSSAAPNLLVAPYWTDLITRGGGICYGVVGAAPNRRWVVEWEDVMEFGGGSQGAHATFEVIVEEAAPPRTNNVIDVAYHQMDGLQRPNAGSGIENQDGSQGVAIPPPFNAPRVVRLLPNR
jgi:hypothetical protein